MIIPEVLKVALEKKASDIILSAESKPCLKINGEICYLEEYGAFTCEELNKEVLALLSSKQKEIFLKELELDFSVELKQYSRFRVNVFSEKKGYGVVFRPIKSEMPSFSELGLPRKLKELTKRKNGLILVTGSVGSGKSTTISSLVDIINEESAKHIITIEDPIEYIFKNKNSLIEQREVGVHTNSFENGLKYALRQASDVIMIGEMRDLETFRLALRAAETGNLVLATLHTSGAARTIARIIDMFPGGEKDQIRSQLSDSLLGVIWQDLIQTKDGKSRRLAPELLINNTAIANMIRKDLSHLIQGAMETGANDGMITMEKSLEILKKNDLI
ncbi:MAG: PilT/PilU family type 4a pilus ATPase [Candidatus Gracilibacteria bacterium]|nr:PilT/PilU family type 4a pilus ATPase [Candidatus Gracilibacteria bacterium]